MYRKVKDGRIGDPISSIFELTEELQKRVKRIRVVLFYTILAGGILAIAGALFVVYSMYLGKYDVTLLWGVVFLASTIAAIEASRQDIFLLSFQGKTELLKKARFWNPTPNIPSGSGHAERFVKYLMSSDENFSRMLAKSKKDMDFDTEVTGKSGSKAHFDACFFHRRWGTVFGYHLFLRCYHKQLTKEDLLSLKSDVDDVVKKRRFPATRVIALQTSAEEIPEDVLELADTRWITFPVGRPVGKEHHGCPIEPIALEDDNKYRMELIYFT